jgi:PAS domain S-box-containing protein
MGSRVKLRLRLVAMAVIPAAALVSVTPILHSFVSRSLRVSEQDSALQAVALSTCDLRTSIGTTWIGDDRESAREELERAALVVLDAAGALADSGLDNQIVTSLRQATEQQITTARTLLALTARPGTPEGTRTDWQEALTHLSDQSHAVISLAADCSAQLHAELETDRRRAIALVHSVILSAVLLSVGGMIFLSRRIIRGLACLGGAAVTIGSGDLTHRVDLTGSDELGHLGSAFNSMVTAMHESRDQVEVLSRAAEQSPISIVVTDLSGVIKFVNPRFSEMSGYPAEEVIGRKPNLLKSGYHSGELYASLWQTITDGRPWHGELVNKKRDGTIYWQQTTIAPVRNQAGRISHFVAVAEDISEKKATDTETARRMSDLAESRRAMLNMMEDLEDARAEAEAATAAKSQFLAAMSHEIRTPINAIIGMHHLLSRTNLTERQRDYVDKLFRSSQTLLRIINDVLDFSKIEANQLELESTNFDLNDVLDTLATLTGDRAQQEGLELIIDIHRDVPIKLVGDPLRLGQILLNLVNNAIKFTESGDVVVSVHLESAGQYDLQLHFAVRDTGIGMSSELLTSLFRPFSQADASTSRRYGGTGLGLSISKSLVERMEGRIWAESKTGSGSTFHFIIGLESQSLDRRKYRLPADDLCGLRTLLVESHDTVRGVLTRYLEGFSFVVTSQDLSDECLDRLEDADFVRGFGLVIIDSEVFRHRQVAPADWLARHAVTVPTLVTMHLQRTNAAVAGFDSIGSERVLTRPVLQSTLFDRILVALGCPPSTRVDTETKTVTRADVLDAVRGARILLVEDNELNQQVATELMEDLGFWITIASNGDQAIETVLSSGQNEGFDAVLMDLHMPGLNGYEAARTIRTNMAFDDLPIIAMTADAMGGVREQVQEAGMNDYVTKPIDPAALYDVLARWIKPGTREQYWPPDRDQDDASSAEFPTVRGIDTRKALKRVGNNSVLFGRLLLSFRDDFGDFGEECAVAIKRKDFRLAKRLAHTLKGVAGNLCAEELYRRADSLDAVLESASPEPDAVRNHLDRVAESVGHLMEAIEERRSELVGETTDDLAERAGSADPATITRLLDSIALAIKRSEPAALDLLHELERCVAGTSAEVELGDLKRQLEQFEFDAAGTGLEAIRNVLTD